MKIKSTLNFFLVFLVISTSFAQEVLITGKVVDTNVEYPLYGASVVVLNNSDDYLKGAVTNEFGEFSIRISSLGNRRLQVSYIGFTTYTMAIEITQSDLDVGTIVLSPDTTTLGEVVLEGSLEGKRKAINLQRTSDNIKNVVSADLIGRNPDLNVTEALQRISGVNISRDKGEGSTVSIRGTPLNYTTIQINGEQIPSVQSDGNTASRSESLDLIPADQLAFLEVTKVPTPDMDGDAIGGTINLKTAVAKSSNLGVRVESALGYNDISDGLNAINRLRIDKRFFQTDDNPGGKLGIIIGGSMFNSNNSEHRTDGEWLERTIEDLGNQREFVLNQYEYRITENERSRNGVTFTTDYKFNNKNKIIFNYMYNSREDDDVRNRFQFDLDGNYVANDDGVLNTVTDARVRRDILITTELKQNNTFNLEGEHKLSDWTIDWKGFYAVSSRDFTAERGDFARDNVTAIADNPQGIYGEEPNLRISDDNLSVYNPFLYNDPRRFENDIVTTEADNLVGKIDLTRSYNLGDNQAYFKFGGKYRTQTNERSRIDKSFVVNDPNDVVREEEFFLRSLSGREPANYLYSDYRFGPLIGANEFRNVLNTNRRFLFESDLVRQESERVSANGTYQVEENISAGYAMTRIQFPKLMVLAGVRYETNEVIYNAFEVVKQAGLDPEITPVVGRNNYRFILPNLHFKYDLGEYTALRLAGAMNYARPNFTDVVPFADQDDDEQFLRLGNPELRPALALNLDVLFEHYFTNVGVISLGGFYKDIDDFQFRRQIPRGQNLGAYPGYPGTDGYEFTQQQNGENAIVAGLEFNFFRSLSFLPGFFKHFNFEGNYTYTYSNAFTDDREDIALPGQADHTFNSAIAFDYKGFTMRVAANYNGSFATGLGSRPEEDTFQDSRLQIDANASIKFAKKWRFYIEGVNLSNEPTIRYQGDLSRLTRRAYFGWAARAGISYKL